MKQIVLMGSAIKAVQAVSKQPRGRGSSSIVSSTEGIFFPVPEKMSSFSSGLLVADIIRTTGYKKEQTQNNHFCFFDPFRVSIRILSSICQLFSLFSLSLSSLKFPPSSISPVE